MYLMLVSNMLTKLILPNGNPRYEGWTLSYLDLLRFLALPIIGVVGLLYVKLTPATLYFSGVYYIATGLGMGAYHRYWSHRAFIASKSLQYVLAILGTAAWRAPIKIWAQEHRAHHRYTDTDKDPYNATLGLFWCHIGWTLVEPPPGVERVGWVDIEDLKNDEVVQWQERHHAILVILMGFVIPTAIPGCFWGDWEGGFVYSSVLRMVLIQHSVWSVNSLAHWSGDKNFDDKHTPVDSNNPIMAILTGGESYHNFHHQFPMDYRNGVKWYHFDFIKWFIWTMSKIGLASHLKTFPENEIKKAEFTMKLKKLAKIQGQLAWPKNIGDLPVISWESYQKQAEMQALILISGFIHDVSQFLDEHPGGSKVIQGYIGKDATSAFFGGVYNHSNAAHNLLSMKRVAVLAGGYECGSPEREHDLPPSQRIIITVL